MSQILIIGAGLNGLGTAYAAWKKGHQVTVIEQFQVGHTLGSSHGESRIIRYSYGDPTYIRLAKRAYHLWHELEDHLQQQLIHTCGGMDLAPADHPGLQQHAAALQSEGIAFERLSAAEATERFPQFQVPDTHQVLYQKDAGILKPDLLLPQMAQFLREQGVSIQENTPVLSVEDGKVVTERWTYAPDQVLVCAGAWVNALLPSPLPVHVTEEQLGYFAATSSKFRFPEMPVFIDLFDGPYGFPQLERPGVKIGLHHHGPTVTPETRSFAFQQDKVDLLKGWLERFMPEVNPVPLETVTCLYTNTPSQDFVIDGVQPGVTVVSACSGHGFKFGPATGELALQRANSEGDAFEGKFLAVNA